MWIDHVRPFFRLNPLQLICLTAYGEARGDGREGMQAVINSVHNRRLHPILRFGDPGILAITRSPYHAIILKRKQYSIYLPRVPGIGKLFSLSDPRVFEGEAKNNNYLKVAVELGELLRRGTLIDITGGADHFLNPKTANQYWVQYFRAKMVYRVTIKHHEFYSEPPHYYQSPQRYQPGIEWVGPAETPPEALPIVAGAIATQL